MDSKGPPYPNAPGFVPIPNQPQPTGYPHPTAQQSYAHPPPPPPYDSNANMIPPTGHHPQHHQQATYVHTIVTAPQVGPDPASITCPSCQKHIVTRLDYETSTKTHIFAGLLCLFMISILRRREVNRFYWKSCWPCFWIPYVIDSCKNANHYCPNCGAYIGTYRG